jgi:uncharacterized membrane protein
MRHQTAFVFSVIATCLLGIMAGFFFAFAIDVAPAMANLDAQSYIATQQWINRVVRNAVFGATYFGSALVPFAAAAAAFWCGRRGLGIAWLLIALVYFAAVFWVTRSVNVPINNELASWQSAAPPSNWQQARDTWNQSNLVRAVASAVCFVAAVVVVAAWRPSPSEA